jgi:hypothetical protein
LENKHSKSIKDLENQLKLEKEKTVKFSEEQEKNIESIVEKALSGKVTPITQTLDMLNKEHKRAALQMFCESQVLAGRVQPYEMETKSGLPTLVDRLMSCDDASKTFKFGETSYTQLEIEKKAIETRPIQSNNEKVKSSTNADNTKTFSEEQKKESKTKFQSFAESKSSTIQMTGMTVADYVKAWEMANDVQKKELESI